MAIVNYYQIDGEHIGDSSSGDYLQDTLGSVTGTSSSITGAVQNVYRYTPYGADLEKTGASPDPKLRWIGARGFRSQGVDYADTYAKERHYGAKQGSWGVAGLRDTSQNPYAYSAKHIVLNAYRGITFKLSIRIVPPAPGPCKCIKSKFVTTFELDPLIEAKGIIVQKVQLDIKAGPCGKPPVDVTYPNYTYWEAWDVTIDHIWNGSKDDPASQGQNQDQFGIDNEGVQCFLGTAVWKGEARFFENQSVKWRTDAVEYANGLPATESPGAVKFWDSPSSNSVFKNLSLLWRCCAFNIKPDCCEKKNVCLPFYSTRTGGKK